jgi:hypothetical protein
VTSLHQHLAGAMVRGQSIRIFLDDKVLNSADRFQKIFFDSILLSEVFVPLVTSNALQRMVSHDPREVDNLLVEWLTALLLMKFPEADSNGGRFPLRFISPICLKDRSGRGYFSLKDTLSRVVPFKTIAALRDLLESKGIICSARVSQFLETVTVKDIVDGVMESICIDKKEDESVLSMVSDCGESIMQLFLRTDGIKVPDPSYLSRREELVIAESEKGGICTVS